MHRNFPEETKATLSPEFIAKLGLIGQLFVTVGDVIAAAAIVLGIEQEAQESNQADQEKKNQEQLLAKMQSQIDALQKELRLLQNESNMKKR